MAAAEKCTDKNDSQKELFIKFLNCNQEIRESIPHCKGCREPIFDRYIWQVLEASWHADCLSCSVCRQRLTAKCYTKDDKLYCKNDYFRVIGSKCASCDRGIEPDELVQHANDCVYHVDCFACYVCTKLFSPGEKFYQLENKKVVCEADYESSKSKDGGNKRPRTTITAKQLETLKLAYTASSKPARHVREQLSQETGLDMRVVQVWFQNRRAKEKRLKKDAGRNGWTGFGGNGRKKFTWDDDDDDMILEEDSSTDKGSFNRGYSHSYTEEENSSDSFASTIKPPNFQVQGDQHFFSNQGLPTLQMTNHPNVTVFNSIRTGF